MHTHSLSLSLFLDTRPCYVVHPGLELRSSASLSLVQGLQVYAAMTNNDKVPFLCASFVSDTS